MFSKEDPEKLLREVIGKGQKAAGKEPVGDISIPSTPLNSSFNIFAPPPPDGKISVQLNCPQEKLAAIAQIASNGGYGKLVGQPGVQVIDVGAGYTGDNPFARISENKEEGMGEDVAEVIPADPIIKVYIDETPPVYMKKHTQSREDILEIMSEENLDTILDNCNTKTFMGSCDTETAEFISERFSDNTQGKALGLALPSLDGQTAREKDGGFHHLDSTTYLQNMAVNANDANLDGPGAGKSFRTNFVQIYQEMILKELKENTTAGLVILDKTSPQTEVDKWRAFLCDTKNVEGLSVSAAEAFYKLASLLGMNPDFLKSGVPEGFGEIIKSNSRFELQLEPGEKEDNKDRLPINKTTMPGNSIMQRMTLEEKAAAVRFCDCCEDFDAGGYDVSSAMMKRLAEIGLVKHRGGGWYEGTALLSSIEDDLRAELALINKEFLVNTNPNIRFRASDVGKSYKKMIDIYGGIDSLQEDNSSLNPFIRIQDDSCPAALPKVPSDFTSSLPQPDTPEAIEQIKKAVKEFRAAWQPMGKKPSLAQTYQLVAKGLGFKTWEAVVAMADRKKSTDTIDIFLSDEDRKKHVASFGKTGVGKGMLFDLMENGIAEEVARILFQAADITPQPEEIETVIRIIKGLPAGAGIRAFIDAYNKSSAEQLRCTPEQLKAIAPLIEALATCTKPGPYGKFFTDGQDSPGVSAPNSAATGGSAQPDSLTSEKLTVNDFLNALEKEPYLIDFGIRCSQHIDRNKSKEENLASFQSLRESFSSSGFKEFAVCCEWLSGCTKRKTINLSYSSYGLKHMVETWMKRQGREDYYVSNGAFIAAAIHMGFDWKPDFDSPNVRFNISKKSPAILELKS